MNNYLDNPLTEQMPSPTSNSTPNISPITPTVPSTPKFFKILAMLMKVGACGYLIWTFLAAGISAGMGGRGYSLITALPGLNIAIILFIFSYGFLHQKKFVVSFYYFYLLATVIMNSYFLYKLNSLNANIVSLLYKSIPTLFISLLILYQIHKHKNSFSGNYFTIQSVIMIMLYTINIFYTFYILNLYK